MKKFIKSIAACACMCALSSFGAAFAAPVKLAIKPGYTVVSSVEKTTLPVKISLNGSASSESADRPSANIAFVIDHSGSMSGEKLAQAKNASVVAISMLRPEDIVSVVIYDSTAEVIVPATKLTDKDNVIRQIQNIKAGSDTALFAGVSRAVAEVMKFKSSDRVNRIILLSDGQANVGPSKPGELGDLGAVLKKDGISVSTIGVGLNYNEDLMTTLAQRSDGNHLFAERAADLTTLFKNEFGDILSVVAQNVLVTVTCDTDIKPVQVIGREAEIYGQKIIARLNQIYASQEKYLLLEIEVPVTSSGVPRSLAEAEITYFDPLSKKQITEKQQLSVSYSALAEDVQKSINRDTISDYYIQLANIESEKAVVLADQGKKDEAVALINQIAKTNSVRGATLNSPQLAESASGLTKQAETLKDSPYDKARKVLRYEQNKVTTQQK